MEIKKNYKILENVLHNVKSLKKLENNVIADSIIFFGAFVIVGIILLVIIPNIYR